MPTTNLVGYISAFPIVAPRKVSDAQEISDSVKETKVLPYRISVRRVPGFGGAEPCVDCSIVLNIEGK